MGCVVAGSDFSPLALRIMRARSGGACEGCGRAGVRLEAHHRQFRSRGGLGGAANGMCLCGFGNTSGCHGAAHSADPPRGWAIESGSSPEHVPVLAARFSAGPVVFTDSGLVLAASGIACWTHLRASVDGVPGCSDCRPAGRVLWEFEEEKGWLL